MIAVTSSGRSFRALSVYLARGHSGREHGRVAWTSPRNIPIDDPELAGKLMRATAAQNTRVVKPVYHLAISFDRRDQVSREQMEQVVDKVLDRLGLREYQAILVAHRDREHAHVHVLVNRVHPETGRAWERWKDRPIIEQVLREEERALDLRQINGRLAPVPGREPPEWIAATGLVNGERRATLRSETEPFIEHVRTHVPALRKSTNWSEFEQALTWTLAISEVGIQQSGRSSYVDIDSARRLSHVHSASPLCSLDSSVRPTVSPADLALGGAAPYGCPPGPRRAHCDHRDHRAARRGVGDGAPVREIPSRVEPGRVVESRRQSDPAAAVGAHLCADGDAGLGSG